jgi:hypothetical protein
MSMLKNKSKEGGEGQCESAFDKAMKSREKAFEAEDQETGPTVQDSLARIVDDRLRRRPNKEIMMKARQKYP